MVIAVLAIAALAGCRRSDHASLPDVVLVVADGLRADRVQRALAAGGDGMPNLARLARDGVVYDRAASPGTWCVPAFASLLTGRWPSYHGAERRRVGAELVVQPIAAEATTLAEILHQRGFHTAAFLSGRDDLSSALGFERGFTDWVNDGTLVSPAALADAVGHWLEAQRGPIFLMVSLDELRDTAVTEAGGDVRRRPRAEITNAVVRSGELPAAASAQLVAEYDAALPEVDDALGDLLGLLQSAGRYAGALVVVTADHGELLGEHGLAGHGWPPFEDALNVPLVVKYPDGRDAGTWIERRVSSVGVFATALDEVGAPLPDDVQAKPLADHHPVWAEDVDRRGRRVRAGYDGLAEKIIRANDGSFDVACTFDMYTDRLEVRPDCSQTSDSALRRAMGSFARRPRPGEATSGLAQVDEGGAGRATN